MALTLTDPLRNASGATNISPQLVFQIEGVDALYGILQIKSVIKLGDDDLFLGDDWLLGDTRPVEGSKSYLSLEGTTTSIKQSLEIDKGRGSSVSSFQVALVDFNNEITELISPGLVVTDILGKRCKVYMGLADNTSWPEDYVVIFRGVIDEATPGAGLVTFNIAHPDQKKRQGIFLKAESTLFGAINDSTTTITLNAVDNFLYRQLGPDGNYDSSITFFIRIDDELIQYTGFSGNTLTGAVRGALGTTASAHDDEADVVSFYRLKGNCIDLALKLMLSGFNGPFVEDVEITNFGNIITSSNTDTIWFEGVDLIKEYNLQIGDYATTTGASNGANNFTLKQITGIDIRTDGTALTIDGVTLVEENDTAGVIDFRSQYDTLGEGLAMMSDEVDIDEHTTLRDRYLADVEYDFYIKDDIEDAKEFLEKEIYLPVACYSLPRKSQSSMGIFTPPIPGAEISTFDKTNILNAGKLKLRRSINKNFINTMVYKFDEEILEEKRVRGVITQNVDSLNRIDIGTKLFVVDSKGLREVLNGTQIATEAINRRLNIYKFAAESIDGLKVHFGDGLPVEIGDVLILDPEGLSLSNIMDGTREKPVKLYFVQNKTINFKNGEISFDLIDTGFSTTGRYALISPSSYISNVISAKKFEITSSFASVYGSNEWKKWKRYTDETIRVRNTDFTNVSTGVIQSVDGNVITLESNLSFTPSVGDIMELSVYNDESERIHLTYAFMTDEPTFDDGSAPYLQL